ncbi:MAG: response regulator transcription factor [SAR202 cluster bacterium]|nr:response regulator transcription factor [SAR202 cluster bacterium]
MSNIRVLVVDDHDLFRRGLIEVLQEDPDMEVIGEARNGKEAIEMAGELSPDLVFMDLNMPGQNGIEATAFITQKWPDMKVLVLTVSEEAGDLYQALSVGARGYVLKISSPAEILDALRQVHQGWVVVSPAMAPRFLSDLSQATGNAGGGRGQGRGGNNDVVLTVREQEILRLVARGLSNAGIAGELMVSENTVKTHIKNILGKLHMKNRSEAANYANRLGITQSDGSP